MSTVRKPVGCLFPMCACLEGRLGCAHEPYDLKRPWNQIDIIDWSEPIPVLPDPFDEVLGG